MQDVNQIFKELIQKQLYPAKILEVTAEENEDHDGDPVIDFRIIFEAENDLIDPDKGVALPRILHPTIREIYKGKHYASFSYMTPEEVEYYRTLPFDF